MSDTGKQNFITLILTKAEIVFLAVLIGFWWLMGLYGGSVVLQQMFFTAPPISAAQTRFIAGIHQMRQQNATVESCQGSQCFTQRHESIVGLRIGPPRP